MWSPRLDVLQGGLAAAVVAVAITAAPRPVASEPTPPGPPAARVVITGANRGIGLELARQYRAAGLQVIGTARRPADAGALRELGATVLALDVTDPASVAALAREIGDLPVDILINNAGLTSRIQSIEALDVEHVQRSLDVNCLGPLRVTQALLPALRRGQRKVVVNITSRLGSVEGNIEGGYYGYRESKAALNMLTRSIAAELRPEGLICIALSPGWVRPAAEAAPGSVTQEESVRGMQRVIDGLAADDTSRFLDYRGERVPW